MDLLLVEVEEVDYALPYSITLVLVLLEMPLKDY